MTSIAVCLPALNEAATIGPICEVVRDLMEEGKVDRLVVVDSGSIDGTQELANKAGAEVFFVGDILPEIPLTPNAGKGEALWRSLAVIPEDIVAWLDSDTQNFGPHFVSALVAPLLDDDNVQYVKAFYERPLVQPVEGALGGGRVTELVARPLINLLYPELAHIRQPLSGEYAGRRKMLTSIPFFTGYAVEIGLLTTIAARFGVDSIAQADLGTRIHRPRSTGALGRMAFEIMGAFIDDMAEQGRLKLAEELPSEMVQFPLGKDPETFDLPVARRPPLDEVGR